MTLGFHGLICRVDRCSDGGSSQWRVNLQYACQLGIEQISILVRI